MINNFYSTAPLFGLLKIRIIDMTYTLEDFLKSGIVSDICQLTDFRDFDTIPISSVSVQELPRGDFIRKNELVLTTASGCIHDNNAFYELIEWMSSSGCCALIITFENEAYNVDASVIALASKLGLPLFRIPWKYKFSDILITVSGVIHDRELSIFKVLQDRLFNLFFESGTMSDAAELIGNTFSCSTMILDSSMQKAACSRHGRSTDTVMSADTAYGDPDEPQGIFTRALSIAINGNIYGSVILGFSDEESRSLMLNGLEQDELEKYICFPLSMWFNRKNIEDMVENRLKNDFVWDLATGNYDSFTEMSKQSSMLGFDLERSYTCVIIRAVPVNRDSYYNDYSAASAAAVNKSIEDVLIRECGLWNGRAMVSGRNMSFIMYLESRGNRSADKLNVFLDSLRSLLLKSFAAYTFFCGLSDTDDKKPDFQELYQEALLALQYCLNTGSEIYRFTYRDARVAQITAVLASNDKIHKLAEDIIRPLTDGKCGTGVDLAGTLAAYIKCGCNTSLTARMLSIHRQSLLYRLEKIEAATNMSLNKHQDIFLLEIGLRIMSYY